jgi:hypothetical protein
MRMHTATCLILCGLGSAGCVTTPDRVSYQGAPSPSRVAYQEPRRVAYQEAPPPPAAPPASSNVAGYQGTQIPWQLTPASTASEAQGERTTIRYVRKLGRVKGTEVALANLSKPMTAYPGPHAVVQPCRRIMGPQATRIGAYSVEAAAAGPERHLQRGARRQQVFFRIFYRNANGIEVRQAALMCTMNTRGTIVAANPV